MRIAMLAAFVVVALAGAAPQARATSVVTVTTVADVVNGDVSSPSALAANPGADGVSLREAIAAVNAVRVPTGITFAPALAGQTIALTTFLPAFERDGTTLAGLAAADGRPAITLDGAAIQSGCCPGVLAVYASGVTISHIRFAHSGHVFAVAVRSGEPGGPSAIRNVRVEDNVFDNVGASGKQTGLWIGMEFPGIHARTQKDAPLAADAMVTNVTVARNVFRGFYSEDAINLNATGVRCSVEDVVIEDNVFADQVAPGAPALELDAAFSDNRILRTRILRNTFTGNWAAIHMNAAARSLQRRATSSRAR